MNAVERDFYEERRRTWRRSAFWRGFLAAAVLGAIIAAVTLARGDLGTARPHIARLTIENVIVDDPARDRLVADLAADENVRAVMLRINSPGGTTTGAESLHAGLRVLAGRKPLVAVMGEVAASGGYVAAISADHIVARGNTLTGSIGVIMEYPDVTGLMQTLGVQMETFRSSDLKAAASPFRPMSAEAEARQRALVADSHAWFRDLVGERRGLTGPALASVANGEVFTGRMALENGLIDQIGGEDEARAHLAELDSALSNLPVEDWAVVYEDDGLGRLLGRMSGAARLYDTWFPGNGPLLLSILK